MRQTQTQLRATTLDPPTANSQDFALDLYCSEVTPEGLVPVSQAPPDDHSSTLPPILLLHGLLGSSTNFGTWARSLWDTQPPSERRRVLVADLRNHGRSPHSPVMTYGAMASDVLRLLDRLAIADAVLVGHSMGGKVAMATSIMAPRRVSKLVVVDIAPVRYSTVDGTDWKSAVRLIRHLSSLPLESLKSKRDADQMLSRHVVDPQLRQFALMNLAVDRKSETVHWAIDLESIEAQLPAIAGVDIGTLDFKPFQGPVLFLKGAASSYMTSAHIDRINSLFPEAKVQEIPKAGHWVHVSAPDDMRQAVLSFLSSSSSPR